MNFTMVVCTQSREFYFPAVTIFLLLLYTSEQKGSGCLSLKSESRNKIFGKKTFYSIEKIFNLNHQACFEIKKPDVYLNKNQDFCIGHKHLNISFFKKEQNKIRIKIATVFQSFVLFYVLLNIANIYNPNYINLLILLQYRLSFSFQKSKPSNRTASSVRTLWHLRNFYFLFSTPNPF